MKRQHLAALLLAVGVWAVAGPAGAVTVDDILGLHRAGASDAIIISKIETDGTVFRLTVDEIIQLKDAGVSDAVITYMINTGKSEAVPEETPPPAAAAPAPVPREEPAPEEDPGGQTEVQGSVYMSLGGYYPNWPGYGWNYYYDPFWWPSFAFYFGYCSPYPYYAYYDPFYSCHPYANDYWYPYYGYAYYGDYPDGHNHGGRHVGSRGGVAGDRTIKNPEARIRTDRTMGSPVSSPGVARSGRAVKRPDGQMASRRVSAPGTTLRQPVHRSEVRRNDPVTRGSVRRPAPGRASRGGIRSPRNPSPPVEAKPEVKTNPTPSRVGQPTRTSGVTRPGYSPRAGASGSRPGGTWGRSPGAAGSGRSGGGGGHASGGGRRSK